MLISHTTTHCHKRVLIQVGSHIIDQVMNCITEEELQTLSQSWKLACEYHHIRVITGKGLEI